MRLISSLLLLVYSARLALSLNLTNQTAVLGYWGSNLAGKMGDRDQKRLSSYCQNTTYDAIILSSVIDFNVDGWPVYDFSNLCSDSDTFSGSELKKCPQIETDIQVCQENGIKVLLSIGGYNGNFSLNNDDDGTNFAFQVWNIFGSGEDSYRPFGKAVVDGFDLEVNKGTNTAYSAFAKRMLEIYASDPRRKYYISAAPTCMVPDHTLTKAISENSFDFLSIHTFNSSTGEGCSGSRNSTFDAWVEYAEDSAYNTNTSLFYGVVGHQNGSNGFISPKNLTRDLLNYKANSTLFGGVTIWDTSLAAMSYDNSSETFVEAIHKILDTKSKHSSSKSSHDSSQGLESTSSIALNPTRSC